MESPEAMNFALAPVVLDVELFVPASAALAMNSEVAAPMPMAPRMLLIFMLVPDQIASCASGCRAVRWREVRRAREPSTSHDILSPSNRGDGKVKLGGLPYES